MINKEKIIKKIDKVLESEKRLLPLLNRHITSSLFYSDLAKEDRDKIIEFFQGQVIRQAKHVNVLSEIKKEVLEGGEDVY